MTTKKEEHCACHSWDWGDQQFDNANHHSACQHYAENLIDVWEVRMDGSNSYAVVDNLSDADEMVKENEGAFVVKTKMPREVLELLPEFEEF